MPNCPCAGLLAVLDSQCLFISAGSQGSLPIFMRQSACMCASRSLVVEYARTASILPGIMYGLEQQIEIHVILDRLLLLAGSFPVSWSA